MVAIYQVMSSRWSSQYSNSNAFLIPLLVQKHKMLTKQNTKKKMLTKRQRNV